MIGQQSIVSSQNVQELTNYASSYNVNEYVQVYSELDTISPQLALDRIRSGKMKSVPYEGNPGMTNSDVAYWLAFTFKNNSSETEFMLDLAYPQLDYLQLALVD